MLGVRKLKKDVIKAIKGDAESFERLIQDNQDSLYRIAYSYVNNKEDALDIVQDTVYKAFISINKLKKPEFFNTWLTRILINCAINHIRKSKKVVYIHDENNYEDTVDHSNQNKEEVIDLHKALNELDVKYKTVVILRYFEDMKLDEIADILKLPLSTVKSQLYRALDKLKIDLEEVRQ